MSEPPLRGGCACGFVRYEIVPPARFVAHCHCENCRRAHGAGFVTYAGIPLERYRLVEGEARVVRWRTDTDATRSFCGTCGTTFLYEGPRWPGEVHVVVGTLIDPPPSMPNVHAYADRAPAWCPITDDLPRYGGETGSEPLG